MSKHTIIPRKFIFLLFFLLFFLLLSIGIYVATPDNVFGNDFYVFHSASRALFIEGISPYSEQVEIANQLGVYGRVAQPGENLLTFSYPPYALFLFYSLAFLPLKLAQSIWISLLFSLLLILPLLSYPLIPRWALISSFCLYPISFGLILGNYAVLIGTLLVFILGYLLDSTRPSLKWDVLTGFLLAFCTIKPQFSALFILFILLLALRSKRWRLIQSFIISFLVFIAFSFILLPSWPLEWYQQLFKYVDSNQAIPHVTIFLQLFLKESTANLLSIMITILMFVVLAWMLRKWWFGSFSSLKILAFIGFLTYFIHPRTVSYEQITFLVPFLIWIFSNPPSTSTLTKVFFYFSAILISWGGFFAAKAGWVALFPLEWIFLFYIIWMGYIFLSPNAVHLQTHDSTVPQTLVESN
ncbi:MAG: hypothetical protein CVU41_14255 [Chloroflexi bacterium HGW-Chloroflexi-3]|nr:MAG: hypothetical protein CVU41_14255 [Chloroflexi bacterium HGW-Chloroflexi-3]